MIDADTSVWLMVRTTPESKCSCVHRGYVCESGASDALHLRSQLKTKVDTDISWRELVYGKNAASCQSTAFKR